MDQQRDPRAGVNQLQSIEWKTVRGWPKRLIIGADGKTREIRLSGEAKLLWQYLWFELAGGRPNTVTFTAAGISDLHGRDPRSVERGTEALADEGLAEIIDRPEDRRLKHWRIYLNGPLDVATARRARQGDGQGDLDFEEAEEPQELDGRSNANPREMEDPADTAHNPRLLDLRHDCAIQKTSDFETSPAAQQPDGRGATGKVRSHGGRGYSPGSAASSDPGERLVAQIERVTAAYVEGPNYAKRLEQQQNLAEVIFQRVGDPALYADLCNELAAAVIEMRWTMDDLNSVISSTNWAYGPEAAAKDGDRWPPKVPKCVYFAKSARANLKRNDRGAR